MHSQKISVATLRVLVGGYERRNGRNGKGNKFREERGKKERKRERERKIGRER